MWKYIAIFPRHIVFLNNNNNNLKPFVVLGLSNLTPHVFVSVIVFCSLSLSLSLQGPPGRNGAKGEKGDQALPGVRVGPNRSYSISI